MGLYLKYLKVHFKSQTQYKMSFILAFISQLIVVFGYYFTIICLFDKFSNIKGFTLFEVLLTYGIIQLGFSFCETFLRGMDQFDELIITGNFDRLMLRPRGLLYQSICEEVSFIKLSRVLQAIIVIIVALCNLNIDWGIDKVIILLLMIFGCIVLFAGIIILMASYCFMTVKGLEVRNILTNGCEHLAQYPIGIFKKGFFIFFTFVIPFGFVNYYPLLYLLGRETNPIYIICPLVTLLFLIPCLLVFKLGTKKYASTGS
jgi:ABC-2 type transport system permease protein